MKFQKIHWLQNIIILKTIEKIIKKNKDIAGVIVEPILANMGLVLPEKNFLKDVA